MNLAAESHVDRSIDGPAAFIETNVVGTFTLLQEALRHWRGLDRGGATALPLSSHLDRRGLWLARSRRACSPRPRLTRRTRPTRPRRHRRIIWCAPGARLTGCRRCITNCSNNYGPYHFPEKLIPHMIIKGLAGKPLPVYGNGENVRDWLYVEDHARALVACRRARSASARPTISAAATSAGISMSCETICRLLDNSRAVARRLQRRRLITFVADRPGHDRRYAIDPVEDRARARLARRSRASRPGLPRRCAGILRSRAWWQSILDAGYRAERIGLARTPEAVQASRARSQQ